MSRTWASQALANKAMKRTAAWRPPLIAGARAFAIKKAAVDKYPDRFETLTSTLKKVYTDPDYKAAVVKTKAPWEYIGYGSPESCAEYVKNITTIGEQYKDLLTGKT